MFNDKAEVPLRVHRVFAQLPVCVCLAAIVPRPMHSRPSGHGFLRIFARSAQKIKIPKRLRKENALITLFSKAWKGTVKGGRWEREGV